MTGSAIRLIVFDFDGTLVDSQANIHRSMSEAFAGVGLPAPAAGEVRRVVGLALELAIERLLPPEKRALVPDLAEGYRQAFYRRRQRPDYHEPLFPGAREALASIDRNDRLLGIATGKNLRGLHAALDRHKLSELFVTLQTPDQSPSKPHPGMMLRAMAETGCRPSDTVLIGDTTYDIEMARNAGVRSLGVAWGYHEPQELLAAGATHIVNDFSALPSILDSFAKDAAPR